MGDGSSEDGIFENLVDAVNLYAEGDLTIVELVNDIFVKLASSGRFDLVGQVVDILPSSVRKELRRIVDDIRQERGTYRPFILGRASEEWWDQIHRRIRHLAELFKPLLETESVPTDQPDAAVHDGAEKDAK